MSEIRKRYSLGIAYLNFGELQGIKRIWNSRDFIGTESVSIAFDRMMYSPVIAEYIDGGALGKNYGSVPFMRKGIYWSTKICYQIFDDYNEFGPDKCAENLIIGERKREMSKIFHDDIYLARLVFEVMKYICLYNSLGRNSMYLSDETYFRIFVKSDNLANSAVEILKLLLVDIEFNGRVIRPRGNAIFRKPHLGQGFDVELKWKLAK